MIDLETLAVQRADEQLATAGKERSRPHHESGALKGRDRNPPPQAPKRQCLGCRRVLVRGYAYCNVCLSRIQHDQPLDEPPLTRPRNAQRRMKRAVKRSNPQRIIDEIACEWVDLETMERTEG